ncbi:MAG: GT4 family glycosyltransferase PelF [Candidatus Zipacnadales bacterium]
MRILLTSIAIEGGGAEQVVADLATGLTAAGHRVEVAFLEGTDARVPALQQAGIQCHRLLARRQFAASALADFTPSCITRLRRLVYDFQPDLIHAHLPRAILWIALAKRLFRLPVPLVYTEHNLQDVYSGWGRWIYRAFLPAVNYVVCVSEAVHKSFTKQWKWSDQRIRTIWNGIRMERSSPRRSGGAVRAELDCDENAPLACNIANLASRKAHDILIAAMTRLHERLPQAQCWVAGSPEIDYAAAEATRQCLAKYGAEGYVKLLGTRSDVPDLLNASDVFVLSSRQEGFPITILEAMAAGKPVVTTNVGGCAEAVVDGETGLVVPPEDPQALAEALEYVLTHPDEARRMGEAGRRRVEEHFTVEAMVKKHVEVYKKVIGE